MDWPSRYMRLRRCWPHGRMRLWRVPRGSAPFGRSRLVRRLGLLKILRFASRMTDLLGTATDATVGVESAPGASVRGRFRKGCGGPARACCPRRGRVRNGHRRDPWAARFDSSCRRRQRPGRRTGGRSGSRFGWGAAGGATGDHGLAEQEIEDGADACGHDEADHHPDLRAHLRRGASLLT